MCFLQGIADAFGSAKLCAGGPTRPLPLSFKLVIECLLLDQRDALLSGH